MHHWITIIQLTCTLLPESSAEYTILKIHFWAAIQTLSRHDKFFISCLDKGDTLASCIVYTAVYTDAEQNQFTIRLKECFPDGLNICRKNDVLLISEENKEKFEKHITHFTEGYQRQILFRSIPESQNSISNIQGIFEGNHTKYIAMSCQNGIRLDGAELSVYDVFRVLRAVTLQVQNFHSNGWLYLDLKPENVILYLETPELVMLFDFDSAVQIENIQPEYISFTKSWSAPEVLQRKVQNIGIQSDVYTIGALLLFLIFGRSPALSDRTKRASWNFESSILAEESPELKRMITDLLKHTLCADVKSRYDSCQQILDVIEPFIESFQKQKPYLETVLPMNSNYFCGRDREITEIHEHLQYTNFLVLHGIGGIGKSELAKHYAMTFSGEYDAVIFVRYQSSILETVANDSLFPVVNLNRESDESDESYFTRKIKILQKICTPRHLIILDNFDTDECENLDELLSLNCKFLLTSRVDFEDIFPQYEVDVLDDFNSLRAIFSRYSRQEINDNTDNIIIALEGHTMAVELVSKQMKLNNISTETMYQKLCKKGIYADDNKIKNLKDGSLRNKTAYAHIEILFSIFDLSETEKQILKYIALIGSNAMQIDYFKGLCELSEMEEISFERLVKSGWIQAAEQDEISVLIPHTLIVDVLCKQLQPDSESCTTFVLNAASIAVQIDSLENADERKAAVQWLDHMTRTISGENEELAYFFRCMVYPVYLGENNYQMVLFAAQKELKILKSSEMEGWIVTALFFARAVADRLGDKETFQKFDILLKEKDLTEEYHIHILQADLLQDIANQDYISAKNTVKQIILIAEKIENDRILANAYSNTVWFENVFGTEDFDRKYYAELALIHMEKFASEHLGDFEPDSRKLADFYSDYGDAYRDCEQYEQAIEYYQKGLKTIQNTQDEKQDFLITSYSAIAVCYQKLQQFDLMIESNEQALSCAEEFYGKQHPETGQILLNYSNALIEEYNATKSRKVLLQCSEVMENAVTVLSGLDYDIQLADLMLKYATVLSELGEYQDSNYYAERACKQFQDIFGGLDENMINIYSAVGDNYLKQGDREHAEKYYALVIQVYEANVFDTEEVKVLIDNALSEL